jgi:pimeloyl-ACP methyl ester carboxylesterase
MAISIRALQGGTRLAFDSVEGITNTVEHMHETIARRPLPWSPRPARPTRAHGLIASTVYHSIRGTNGLIRAGTDRLFGLAAANFDTKHHTAAEVRTIAAVNGVIGDHLEATKNALAIPMTLLYARRPLELNSNALTDVLPDASPHLVVLVHGLSLSELSWNRKGTPGLGQCLQDTLDCTSLYLRYNTGRHISTNGREFAQLLQQLCDAWPVPVESLSLIGHSMGGLVIRSACWYAAQEQSAWLERLQRVVCLGTPHHGAVLERAGHAFDVAIQQFPYLAPLAFGRHRSAGIKDLSHGDLLDEDWQDQRPDRPRPDKRRPVPLLPDVDYFFVAATLGRDLHDPLGRMLGDLLVRLDSAVGTHGNELKKLDVKPDHCRVFHESNHFDLLDDARVHQQIIEWFQ